MPTCKIKLIVNKVQSFLLSDKKLYLYNNIWHTLRYSYFSNFLALIRVSNIFLMECWPQLPLSITWHSRQMIPVIKTLHWPTSVFILLLGKYVIKIITLEQEFVHTCKIFEFCKILYHEVYHDLMEIYMIICY